MLLNLVKMLKTSPYKSMVGLLREGWLYTELKKAGIPIVVLNFRGPYDFRFLVNLVCMIKKTKIDIIHSHLFGMNLYGALAAKLTSKPLIATVHGETYDLERRRRILAYKMIAKWSQKIVTVSRNLENLMMKEVGIDQNKILTIYNGIDLARFSYSNGTTVRRDLGLKSSEKIVGIIAGLRPVKGHHYFLQAASHVLKDIPSAKFLIVGDGALRNQLISYAKRLNIERKVMFTGFRRDIPELLSIMDVFVVSSLSEGLSLSLLEAMAAGKAIVATRVGGNVELIQHNRTGFFVPPRDPVSMAEAIILLLKHKPIAVRMGEIARQKALKEFDCGQMRKKYEGLYEICLRMR